jgi:hypothetical protein
MWIIIDKRMPEPSKLKLRNYGDLIELESHNIVYDAISGHPDIFLCQADNQLIIAPNAPSEFVDKLKDSNIDFTFGNKPLGMKYPETAFYNAVVTDKLLIHNLKVSDSSILESCKDKIHIQTNQAYTRCSLISLDENSFITSDRGIARSLMENNFKVLYVDPSDVQLQGFDHGFFGGCCGIFEKKLFVNGRLKNFSAKDDVVNFVNNLGVTIIELYDGPLHDVGGIFFMKT